MKQQLLLFALAAAAWAGQAQNLSIDAAAVASAAHSAIAQAPAASADAFKWGHADAETFSGLGTQKTGTFGVATKVPGTTFLKGGKVASVNLPVCYAGMTNVKVWGRKNLLGSENLFTIAVPDGTLSEGFNEIALDEAYTIDGDFYVGYTFSVTSVATNNAQYPIGVFQGAVKNSLFLALGGEDFQDYSDSGYGVSALQLFIEDIEMANYGANFVYDASLCTLPSTTNQLQTEVLSVGKQAISCVEYTIDINGQVETRTANVRVAGGMGNKGTMSISYTSPAEAGAYTIDLCITKINGNDNEKPEHTTIQAENVSRQAQHKVLVEEFTGTGCGYCPRGWVGMEAIKAEMSDVAVPIAVHQYNSSDPMYIDYNSYAMLPVQGAPSAVINRGQEMDPYYGTTDDAFGVMTDINAHLSDITPVDILSVSGTYNEAKTQVEAKAELEMLGSLGSYTVEFVLTADSLAGTSSTWRQTNYYCQYLPAQAGVVASQEPELASFCKGGTNGKTAVFLTFNDVAIASSYAAGVNVAPALPLDFKAGDVVSPAFTLKMPTKTTLKNAIRSELVFVNVMVFDENGACVNAARSRVLAQGETEESGIEQVRCDAATTTGRYNLAGQAVGEGYRGLTISGGRKQIVIE